MITSNEAVVFSQPSPNQRVMRKPDTLKIREGRYQTKFAQTAAEIESALRLRHEVFNVELAAAPPNNTNFGLEFDAYDALCRHLLVVDNFSGKTVGTYRLNSIETAKNLEGFYSHSEFSIEDLPSSVLNQSVEVGRASIAREYRNSKVLFLLWKSLFDYLRLSRKRYFFGCCSIFTRDIEIGAKIYQNFKRCGLVHNELNVSPRAEKTFPVEGFYEEAGQVELPSLFDLYLKIGTKICGKPTIDREFGTIDFFVIFDFEEMTEKYRKMFFNEPLEKNAEARFGF